MFAFRTFFEVYFPGRCSPTTRMRKKAGLRPARTRVFARADDAHFGDFAAAVRAYRPEVYERVKAFLPGMWLNARLGGSLITAAFEG